jgi:hypothetical protein
VEPLSFRSRRLSEKSRTLFRNSECRWYGRGDALTVIRGWSEEVQSTSLARINQSEISRNMRGI